MQWILMPRRKILLCSIWYPPPIFLLFFAVVVVFSFFLCLAWIKEESELVVTIKPKRQLFVHIDNPQISCLISFPCSITPVLLDPTPVVVVDSVAVASTSIPALLVALLLDGTTLLLLVALLLFPWLLLSLWLLLFIVMIASFVHDNNKMKCYRIDLVWIWQN